MRFAASWGVVLLGAVIMALGFVASNSPVLPGVEPGYAGFVGAQFTLAGFILVAAGFMSELIVHVMRKLKLI